MNIKKLKSLYKSRSKINFYAVALLSLLYFLIFLVPQIKTLVLNLAEATQLRSEIAKIERDWAGLSRVKKRISELNAEIGAYEKRLPGKKEIPAILQYLSDAARELDINITEIKPVAEDRERTNESQIYFQIPVLLKAQSRYHQLGRFLNKLENAQRFIKIGDIRIVANPRKRDMHYVQLKVITYVMKR